LRRRLLFVVNELDFFLSHRLPLAIAARGAGYEVHVATRPGENAPQLRTLGFEHHTLELSRSGKNPFVELMSVWYLWKLRPDVSHLVTIKPVLYGGLAARLAGVPGVVAAVSGLGFVFTSQRPGAHTLRRIVTALYRLALGHPNLRVIFQNPADRSLLMDLGVVRPEQSVMIPGSGIDLHEYREAPEPEGEPVVVMAARLLKDKGVAEFVGAARQLRREGVRARFALAGEPDPGNPLSVGEHDLAAWRASGDVELLGFRRDVADLFAASHIVVLPSYYGEGLPKVLAEAAACGRAVITTDWPGCRDAIEVDVTGVLVPVKDVNSLSQAIRRLIEDHQLRQRMGRAGRLLAERRYAIGSVVAAHLAVYAEVVARS
jgi:glycosyltransferase involved in cell wall biosynthesis